MPTFTALDKIPLGFSVPAGDPVEIPIGHMAVTGQTQAAGKTTCLEACAARSDRAVLAFVTKRGESAFGAGPDHRIQSVQPYYREHADWEYVESILEAVMRERMKRERSWIMAVSKGAKSLKDVHSNVKEKLHRARPGYAFDMYSLLDAYFDKVVPQIRELPEHGRWTDLIVGLNVMNLSRFSTEVQSLVIASCLDYVYKHCRDTIVVIPEAWEFIPQGRKSPVTYAAEAFIRKGGALKNYLWIDSQDLAGVHTPVLKQISVWLLGVQREKNEIQRTLAHVHGAKKPKPDAIASLGLGQFIACFQRETITTYVRPTWMSSRAAINVAQGHETITDVTPNRILQQQRQHEDIRDIKQIITDIEDPMDMDAALRRENDELRRQIAELQERLREDPRPMDDSPTYGDLSAPSAESLRRSLHATHPSGSPDTDVVALWPEIRALILRDAAIVAAVRQLTIKHPKLNIIIQPKIFDFDESSPRGRIAKMIADGIADSPVSAGAFVTEAKRTGSQMHPARVAEYLSEFVQAGFLTRDGATKGTTYVKAPGLEITRTRLEA